MNFFASPCSGGILKYFSQTQAKNASLDIDMANLQKLLGKETTRRWFDTITPLKIIKYFVAQ